jgi:prolyl-tRNA synthetase
MRWSAVSPESAELALASAQVVISIIDAGDIEVQQSAEILFREFGARGCKILLDDRTIPGEQKLAVAMPEHQVRIHLGARWLSSGDVELCVRGGARRVKLEDAVEETMRFCR